MRASVFSTVLAVTYSIVYLIAVENNYALFTYHPALVEFGWGVQPPRDGPAMYWYGWMATAGVSALVLAMTTRLVPQRAAQRLAPSWAWIVPLAVLAAFTWLLRGFFLR